MGRPPGHRLHPRHRGRQRAAPPGRPRPGHLSGADDAADAASAGFGVYVHVPFCARRCDYCDFATWTDRGHLVPRYLAGVRLELERAADSGALAPATSVFVGGGTPSAVPADALLDVLAAVPLAPEAEVTVECNPEDAELDRLEAYRRGGVTRLSFGVQSMVDHVLVALGRVHDRAAVGRAVEAAGAAGFATFNLDLIFGAVGESVEDWRRSLDAALALGAPHVSTYALTPEPGTALGADPARHPDDDDQAEKYALAGEVLGGAGLSWYEISNWARPGHECRHNLLTWAGGEYLGVGCAAHSHVGGRRWWNVRTPERYLAAVESGRPAEAAGERLEAGERERELLMLRLRTRHGVPAGAFDPHDLDGVLAPLVDRVGDRAVLSPEGRLLANEVAVRLRSPNRQ